MKRMCPSNDAHCVLQAAYIRVPRTARQRVRGAGLLDQDVLHAFLAFNHVVSRG